MRPNGRSTRRLTAMLPPIDYGTWGRLGILLPSGNTAAEPQFSAARPEGLAIHWTRLPLTGSSEAQLRAMADGVEGGARLLRDAHVGLIAFHCTAVSTWAPELEAEILQRITAASGCDAVATSQALVSGLQALGARRIVMVSPYVEHIARREERFFAECGFDVLASHFLGIGDPHGMLAVPPLRWLDLLRASADDRADAYVLSCTAVRGWEAVDEAEAALQRPVITSNSAMLWYACRRLGHASALPSCGRLGGSALQR